VCDLPCVIYGGLQAAGGPAECRLCYAADEAEKEEAAPRIYPLGCSAFRHHPQVWAMAAAAQIKGREGLSGPHRRGYIAGACCSLLASKQNPHLWP
jgi:hypothetical protein